MKILENVLLAELVYYKIGGRARYVIQVVNQNELHEAIHFARQKHIVDIRVLGLGSNILLPDSDFEGVVIWMSGEGNTHEVLPQDKVKAFAGETMDSLIQFSFKHSLIGLEWAGGLPSTIGGAIRGNAGAFGSETKETLQSVEAIDIADPNLSVKTFSNEECHFSYRHSFFKDNPNLIIVAGTFQLKTVSEEELMRARVVYQNNIDYRQTHHPMEYPSCGSVFKNITKREDVEKVVSVWPEVRELSEKKWHNKVSMGYIINKLGFSGKRIGGAMVSPKHTNYIINVENAHAEDVRELIEEIQSSFKQTFGFIPEPELMISGGQA